MSDGSTVPPAGWYGIASNPDELAYFDGRAWTWRCWRLPGGGWHQQPILPPSPTVPSPTGTLPAMAPPPGAGPASWAGGGGQGWAPAGSVELHLAEPQRQRRWATLLRGVLVLPHVVVLSILAVGVWFATIAMWFATLVTGRVPGGPWRFCTGVLQWEARVLAYWFFLTDHYPPFRAGDAPYPAAATLEPPVRFNRLAVLFRAVLAVPAAVVVSVYSIGSWVFSVATWLATLVLGRCPRSLHLMVAAWLRYQLRYTAYFGLLTTVYPSAPLGDSQTPDGSLLSGEIVLRGAARAFAVSAIVLGAVLYAFDVFAPIVVTPARVESQAAITDLNALQSRSVTAQRTFQADVASCAGTWRCVDGDTPLLEQSLQTQIATLETITFPTVRTRQDAGAVVFVLEEEQAALARMQAAGTQQRFEGDAGRLVVLTRRLVPLVRRLRDDLVSSAS